MTVHPALPAVYVTLSCVGIAFAIACLIFNFVYRNAKYVCIDTIYICIQYIIAIIIWCWSWTEQVHAVLAIGQVS